MLVWHIKILKNLSNFNWIRLKLTNIHSVHRIVALMGMCANTGGRVVITWLKPYLNARALIFFVWEGSSQPIANQLNMQKIMVLIILTIKATIFETHSIKHTAAFLKVITLSYSYFKSVIFQLALKHAQYLAWRCSEN